MEAWTEGRMILSDEQEDALDIACDNMTLHQAGL